MTARETLKRYRIKLPRYLGKVLYIQSLDIKKEIIAHLFLHIVQLLFCSFGFLISIIMLFSAWETNTLWHGVIGILMFPFLFAFILILKNLFTTPLIIICDKGIARYTLYYSHKIYKTEFLEFKDATHCIRKEGYVDPYSPVSNKGYRIATTWYRKHEELFSIVYFKEDEVNDNHHNKEAAQIAKECYELFCIQNNRKN